MGTARNGATEIYYEEFGDPAAPALLLVNGLGSQCLNYAVEWCQLFCDEGFHVLRFDNRDVGLSTKLEGTDYRLADMADDAIAVLDAVGVEKAHVMGCSMGGMIVQRLAIDHPDRLLSMTSVMSRTGEAGYGDSSPEALAFLLAPPAPSPRRLHRPSGGRPPRLRVEARVAGRRRHPCPGRRGLRPLLLPGRDRATDEGRRARRFPVRTARRAGPARARDPRQPGHSHRPQRRPPHRCAYPGRALITRSTAWATTTRRRYGTNGCRFGRSSRRRRLSVRPQRPRNAGRHLGQRVPPPGRTGPPPGGDA